MSFATMLLHHLERDGRKMYLQTRVWRALFFTLALVAGGLFAEAERALADEALSATSTAALAPEDEAAEDEVAEDELEPGPSLALSSLFKGTFEPDAAAGFDVASWPELIPPPELMDLDELLELPETHLLPHFVARPEFSLILDSARLPLEPAAGLVGYPANLKPKDILTTVPVDGPISSEFGSRVLISFSRPRQHKGVDIKASRGSAVLAAGPGEVVFAGRNGTYGLFVKIDHGNGIATCYAHMDKCVVKAGQWIEAGDTLGKVGRTGRTTGANLHFEVRINGQCINPREVFAWADSPPRKNRSRPIFKSLDLPPVGADLLNARHGI